MNDRFPLIKFLIFSAVCLGFSVWMVAVIGNISFEDRKPYQAEFSDVAGLLVNDAVKVSGVTVGKVTGMQVQANGTALVDFEVRDDIVLGDATTLEVRWRDVFGLRFLYVAPGGDGDLDPDHVFALDATSSPADLGLLLQRLTPFMRALTPERQNLVLQALVEGIGSRTQEVRDIIINGASLTQGLASRDDELRRLLSNSSVLLSEYAVREDDLRGLLDAFADVSTTLSSRNDTLNDAIGAVADNQAELERLVDANDGEIRLALDALDEITGILAVNRDNLDLFVKYGGRGLGAYHQISRLGQWFNINAPGLSFGYQTLSTDRGAELPPRNGGGGGGGGGAPASNGINGFFEPAQAAASAGGR